MYNFQTGSDISSVPVATGSAPMAATVQVGPYCEATVGVLSAVGKTPLVQLRRLVDAAPFRLYAKLEMCNPAGSVKDRPALNMLMQACARGEIDEDTTIVESSSGNLGIGLAQACAYLGLRFICVFDPKTTPHNVRILEAYGAQVEMITTPDPATGDFLPARLARVRELRSTIEKTYWCNQYANYDNAAAHHRTMDEIVNELGQAPDYFICSTGTCGTLRGCSDFIEMNGYHTRVIAVDAVGSVIFGGPRGKRLIPGHGAARVPELFRTGMEDEHVYVTDAECVRGCQQLLRREAIFAGGSSGAVVSAFLRLSGQIRPDSTCVLLLCDRGERYLDTIYSPTWVQANLGI